MNELARSLVPQNVLLRKSEVYSILDEICQDLELTTAQMEAAKASYEAVADWLSSSDNPTLQHIDVYPHGSAGLGTSVKPLGREDFDVDVICLVFRFACVRPPAELKKIVGDRLRENPRYAAMLEEKKRCWRLNYAREFHLDVSPTIVNPSCNNGGELVPDKSLSEFKPTNPKGYRALFEKRSLMRPRLKVQKAIASDRQANIEPFPIHRRVKDILRRTVQLLKRHRDIYFFDIEADIAPISIVITTLAAQAYEYCVNTFTFDSELDVVIATIRMMPHFIDRPFVNGQRMYVVANETTIGENFAERWNKEPARATAFYAWNAKALADFENLSELEGLDRISKKLGDAYGKTVVSRVMDARTEQISSARAAQKLFVAPMVGLTLTNSDAATAVPKNTYFGDE
ncbi:nucleotidyltransferase [Mesorhizobium calcicola]|uniref:Nucleotidyltransferase n=1 Tax=Mesorhizobium calcicola TaxID=1300310 RepID=A0ABW4WFW5_9HYPH